MLRFTDGMSVDTSGPLRTAHLRDGWYVLGQGMMIPCTDKADAEACLKSFLDKK